jgi:hypothetical protein
MTRTRRKHVFLGKCLTYHTLSHHASQTSSIGDFACASTNRTFTRSLPANDLAAWYVLYLQYHVKCQRRPRETQWQGNHGKPVRGRVEQVVVLKSHDEHGRSLDDIVTLQLVIRDFKRSVHLDVQVNCVTLELVGVRVQELHVGIVRLTEGQNHCPLLAIQQLEQQRDART